MRSEGQAVSLNQRLLKTLATFVRVPEYSRARLRPALCHIGAGAFNRSHLAVYLDDLLNAGAEEGWSEVGVGLMPGDACLNRALKEQDWLYGLLEKDSNERSYRVIGSLSEHLYAPEAPDAVIARLASPECRIVSMTVTEGGYFPSAGPHGFQEHHPDVRHDLEHPEFPRTWLGYVAAGAEQRRKGSGQPFTLLSCDNLQGNGDTAKQALLAFAELRGGKLRAWLEAHVSFPNSMVDRITPRTTDADREMIADLFGVQDAAPVVCEPFRQWVLEDHFVAGRPAWEEVGAQFTEDVAAYEVLKMRVLNGGHSCFNYAAAVLGKEEVAQALQDADLAHLLAAFHDEIRPILRVPPGIEPGGYMREVAARFGNEAVRDQVSRICSEGTAKMMKFILPSVRDKRQAGEPVPVLAFVVASWLWYQRGVAENGTAYAIADSLGASLQAFVADGARNASVALAQREIFGELGADATFGGAVQSSLNDMGTSGMRKALLRALQTTEGGERHA